MNDSIFPTLVFFASILLSALWSIAISVYFLFCFIFSAKIGVAEAVIHQTHKIAAHAVYLSCH